MGPETHRSLQWQKGLHPLRMPAVEARIVTRFDDLKLRVVREEGGKYSLILLR
jgi:hypothetical protein